VIFFQDNQVILLIKDSGDQERKTRGVQSKIVVLEKER